MAEQRFDYMGLQAYLGEAGVPASAALIRDFSRPMAETYRLVVWIGDDLYEASSFDAFQALELVRQQFEPAGWLLGIQGCSVLTRMSGGLRDSLDGTRMYESAPSASSELPETVSTFAPAAREALATIEAQQEAWRATA